MHGWGSAGNIERSCSGIAVYAAICADTQPALDSAEVGALELPFDLARVGGRVHVRKCTGLLVLPRTDFHDSYTVRTLTAQLLVHAVGTPKPCELFN